MPIRIETGHRFAVSPETSEMRPIRPQRLYVILQVWGVLAVATFVVTAFSIPQVELTYILAGAALAAFVVFCFGFHFTAIALCPEVNDYIVKDDFVGHGTRAVHTYRYIVPKNWEQAEALRMFLHIRAGIYLYLRIWKYIRAALILLAALFGYLWWKTRG